MLSFLFFVRKNEEQRLSKRALRAKFLEERYENWQLNSRECVDLKYVKNRYVFTADFLLFNFEVLFSSQENAIFSFDVNAPQRKSCVTLCVYKSSRHFTRIKCLRSIIVSKLECHILTKKNLKNLNIFKT